MRFPKPQGPQALFLVVLVLLVFLFGKLFHSAGQADFKQQASCLDLLSAGITSMNHHSCPLPINQQQFFSRRQEEK